MGLNKQRKEFVDRFLELGNQTQAYKLAYPNCKNDEVARKCASRLMTIADVIAYRDERLQEIDDISIAKPREVLQYFTKVMRGDIKDQFDLDVSVQDKTEAAKQLAKRFGLDKAIDDKEKSGGSVVFEFKRE